MLAAAKRYTRIVGFAAISIVFIVFAVDNREMVHVSLFPLPYMADMPLFLFAILVFFVGAMAGFLCSRVKAHKLAVKLKAEEKRVAALQNQLDGLMAERLAVAIPAPALAL